MNYCQFTVELVSIPVILSTKPPNTMGVSTGSLDEESFAEPSDYIMQKSAQGLGRIANEDLLRFIATSTFGAYFQGLPKNKVFAVPGFRNIYCRCFIMFYSFGFVMALYINTIELLVGMQGSYECPTESLVNLELQEPVQVLHHSACLHHWSVSYLFDVF